MNPTAISASVGLATNLWKRFKDYRDEKALEAYTALEAAAAEVEERSKDAFPEARRSAGAVTQAAHDRLERSIAELKDRGQEVSKQASERFDEARKDAKKAQKKAQKNVKKQSRKQAKAARKAADKARKRSAKKLKNINFGKEKKSSKFWPFALILALISAIGGGLYYFFKIRKEEASEFPPRVEDFTTGANAAAEGSTLVYTSTTEDDHKVSDLAEEGVVERDEELLGSIDEQLAKHKEEAEAAADADTSRITDDRDDEGKHRLQTNEQE
ncbi:hypothetical protein [Corynebacterium striatum]|uniref:hypothetical protein n=1 Tax=Corynebacterium striatum TaxID=43770 RepID=UPI000C28C7D2|nr:hypothetical protein [Corynebacterium striatum]ATZ06594.1 hypothetical protein BBR43_10705 [Corynebacterium striatum]MDK8789433.1 hypothetical protein [Corynebacterium striatum]MDK8808355.1 hypothetical protein [Corynebacterium striatum]MDK8832974.1 hypothetical protein [Corynebacterium striatum]MDK8877239.1 hypothetical protein [Corynebacterium striatum]